MKRRRRIFVSLITIILLVILIVGANIFVGRQPIDKVVVSVSYGNSDTIISSESIRLDLTSRFGDLSQKNIKDVDADEVEKFLKSQPYIEDAEVYLNFTGKVKITVTQAVPILRLYSRNGMQFYIDRVGKIINIKDDAPSDVIIASGDIIINTALLSKGRLDTIDIDSKKGVEKTASSLYYLALKLYNDTILAYQIDQIYIPNQSEFEFFPKIGDYTIKVGDINNLEEKFNKLNYLYKEAFSVIGWDNYSVVNLCYKDQVVCTRK